MVPPAEATCVYLRAGVILNCLKKRCRCSRGEIWRDMARHGETIEFIQSLCRWRLADRAEGGAMVAAGC